MWLSGQNSDLAPSIIYTRHGSAYLYNPRSREVGDIGSGVQDHSQLSRKFNQGYMRSYIKQQQKQNKPQ